MHEFGLLFRTNDNLPPDQLARRAKLVRDWAIHLRETGVFRSTALFESTGVGIGPGGKPAPIVPDGAVAGVTVIQAADFDAAVKVAQTFPGLAFGTTVEVRALKPLPGGPPATSTAPDRTAVPPR